MSACGGNLSFHLELGLGSWAPLSCMRESSPLWSFERELGIAFKVLQEKMASSHFEGGISWFVSSCSGWLGIPLQVPRRTQGASCVASGKSSLHSSCEGEPGVFWSHGREIRAPFAWKGEYPCLSSCSGKCAFPLVSTGT